MGQFHFSPRPNRAGEIRWREWGPAAFREAAEGDRPILLGISAVWCHWCHVMDETSYSDDEVIRLANERYVPVRVDNDQRPDVNRRYNMGGWPTTAFLTPDGEILHGGTYIPPEPMRRYLREVADLWKDRKDELRRRVAETRAKETEAPSVAGRGALTWEIVDRVASLVRGQYDPEYGGFGREPKFPQPKLLRFLVGEYERTGDEAVASMLRTTLDAMAGGGMYDRVEGGFFRYSTTRQWQVPHYEKMLEDNAELLQVYAEAHRLFPAAGYGAIARDVIRWMDATLWMPDRTLFAGSQDADERYYALASRDERATLASPHVDRTIFTGWNALAGSAYLAASRALGDPALGARALEAIMALGRRMDGDEGVAHFDAGTGPRVHDLLADLAPLLSAVLDLYESGRYAGPMERAFGRARSLALRTRDRLEDPERGGFYDAPEREELGRVAAREKPIEDGALAADALLRLGALTGDDEWRRSAVRALEGFVGEYRQWGQFAASYAGAVSRALAAPLLVTVVGARAEGAALWRVALAANDPAISLRPIDLSDEGALRSLGYPPRAAAYVCVGTVCSEPLLDPMALERELVRAKGRFASD